MVEVKVVMTERLKSLVEMKVEERGDVTITR